MTDTTISWVPSSIRFRTREWPYRPLALLATVTLLGAMLAAPFRIVQVDGDPMAMLAFVAGALIVATLLARFLPVPFALGLAAVLLVGGLSWYVSSLPYEPHFGAMIQSNLELLSGQSLLYIERSGIWALAVTPAPVFVIWYLALREWYTTAAIVGSAMLGYFVLTGDAGQMNTLLGVVAATALLGLGDLARREASISVAEAIAVVLAIMVVAPLVVSIVPSGSAAPITVEGDESGSDTIEASLLSTGSEMTILGSIKLSEETRFTIESSEPRRWRVASFDRYTGESWVDTGSTVEYADRNLARPGGETRLIEQTVTATAVVDTMPAAWRPIGLDSDWSDKTRIARDGSLVPRQALKPGDSYDVVSAVPDDDPAQLETNGADPPEVQDRYTQLPATTPDRLTDRTDAIVAGTDTRYGAATAIEGWLEANREYSLEVDKPSGDVADAFLFEMERGYCVYYATTMAAMLRSQDIPARMTVGYTPGEPIDDEEFRVRGYNSHAWVEVYFPNRGWRAFDPTPAGPRRSAEQAQAPETAPGDSRFSTPPTPTESEPTATPPTTPDDVGEPTPGLADVNDGAGDDGFPLPPLPSREELALGLVVFVGAIAGIRRNGVARRLYRSVWIRWQPRSDPGSDVERAFRRLSYVLERDHRAPHQGETVREYLDAIDADERSRQVAAIRERARYGAGATEADADEAVELVDRIVSGDDR